MKQCSKCKQPTDPSEFHRDKSRPDGLKPWCKQCCRAAYNPLQRQRSNSKWYANNRTAQQSYRRVVKYGITTEQYARLLLDQENSCAICARLFEGVGKASSAPCVDHDHNTGSVRGILCGACNKMIGLAREDQTSLLRAVDYLKR